MGYFTRLPRSDKCPRVVWWQRRPWLYRYEEGGFEGYQVPFTRRRLAPDLPLYAKQAEAGGPDA